MPRSCSSVSSERERKTESELPWLCSAGEGVVFEQHTGGTRSHEPAPKPPPPPPPPPTPTPPPVLPPPSFEEGRNISETAVVLEAGRALGLPEDELAAAFGGSGGKEGAEGAAGADGQGAEEGEDEEGDEELDEELLAEVDRDDDAAKRA